MAEDYTVKRRALATKAIEAVSAIDDYLSTLDDMRAELSESGGGFADADFIGIDQYSHLNAWKMNNLINDVVPGLVAALATPLQGSTTTYNQVIKGVRRA